MLQIAKDVLKETVLFLILLNVVVFLIPTHIKISFKMLNKCLYKVVKFLAAQSVILVKKGMKLYVKRQKQLNLKDQVAQEKVICLSHYKKAK